MLKVFGIVLSVLLIIATCSLIVPVQGQDVDSFQYPLKKTVRVINNLAGTQLSVHCHSGDDDLGQHYLHSGQYVEWSFEDNFWGTTLYWCDFAWNNVQKSFRVYSTKKDDYRGYKPYLSIRPDGAYFYDGFKFWLKKIPW